MQVWRQVGVVSNCRHVLVDFQGDQAAEAFISPETPGWMASVPPGQQSPQRPLALSLEEPEKHGSLLPVSVASPSRGPGPCTFEVMSVHSPLREGLEACEQHGSSQRGPGEGGRSSGKLILENPGGWLPL